MRSFGLWKALSESDRRIYDRRQSSERLRDAKIAFAGRAFRSKRLDEAINEAFLVFDRRELGEEVRGVLE